MSSGRHEVVNEYRIPSNYPEHAAIVQIHGPPGIKRGAQVKPAVRPNSLAAEVADDIRHAFVQYDSDHSGYIELRELERVTAALTLAHSPRPLTQTLTQTRTTLRRSGAHAHAHARTTMPYAVHTNAHAKHAPPASTHQARATRPRPRFEARVRRPQEVRRQPERPAWPEDPTMQRPSSTCRGGRLWLARHSPGEEELGPLCAPASPFWAPASPPPRLGIAGRAGSKAAFHHRQERPAGHPRVQQARAGHAP